MMNQKKIYLIICVLAFSCCETVEDRSFENIKVSDSDSFFLDPATVSGGVLSIGHGYWKLVNNSSEPLRVELIDFLSIGRMDVFEKGSLEALSRAPGAKQEDLNGDYLVVGPNTTVKIEFLMPTYYEFMNGNGEYVLRFGERVPGEISFKISEGRLMHSEWIQISQRGDHVEE